MQEIEFSRLLFELPAKQHSQFSPSGSTFLPCLGVPSKSHRQNSISSIFLESPHQVDMKILVKRYKHFFGYFIALKTHGELAINLKLHCKCLQEIAGTLQGNRSAGISNLWGHRFSQNANQKLPRFLTWKFTRGQVRSLGKFWLAFWEKR